MSLGFKDALGLYLTDLEGRGYAKSTLLQNRRWLGVFADFCEDQDLTEVRALTVKHVSLFQRTMTWTVGAKGKVLSQNTLHQCLRMTRSFLRWLHTQEHLLCDITESWILPRTSASNTRIPTTEEMTRLLLTPNETQKVGIRNRAVMELLYGTGLRSAEFCALKLEHLDLASSRLQVVQGKGKKSRYLPLGARLKQVLKRYLTVRQHLAREGEQALFVNREGAALSSASLGELISSTAKAAGLEPFRSHAIRRSFATHLLENGANVHVIGALLGHKNLSSTQLYTRVDLHELKKVYRRTHPRAERL